MHMQNSRCDNLIEKTAMALNNDVVALMLLVVQRDNLQLSVKAALNSALSYTGPEVNHIVRQCLFQFPYLWLVSDDSDLDHSDLDLHSSFNLLSSNSNFDNDSDSDWFTMKIMSLPSIQTLTISSHHHHHLILAVILILKQATFLRLSKLTREAALTRAHLDYQEANIDLKIQLLMASSQEHSVALFAGFIMATDIDILVKPKKDHWFKRFWEPVFAHKSISWPKLRND